ncbi:MAG: Ferric reductase domain protein transmembrane component domain protein [Parcubacteria group bacterium GW2011_GWD2_38_11]|nr:MAG: Ferric reductase domain protein transmembrane component domain protein [Parcubacteria group bacterium GW2011_GWD2_38_11]
MKKYVLVLALSLMFFGALAKAQQQPIIDYQGQPVVDSDLDGLTDQAEIQVYKTDPNNSDTDGDGYYDGPEALAGSNPLVESSIPGMPSIVQEGNLSNNETPWPWYIARASGLAGFILLYLSIFLGLIIRIPFLYKFFAPLYAMQGHCWIALQATVFAFLHGFVLIFDKFLGFGFADVFVPFASSYKPVLVGLGTVGFYLMIILTVSSYGRRFISQKLWRILHFANIILYAAVIAHAYFLGTDMKNDIVRNIFVYANIFLIILMLGNMFIRIKQNIIRRNSSTANSQ